MAGLLDDPRIDWNLLDRYGFDRQRFERYASEIAAGRLSDKSSLITDPIEPAPGVIDVAWEGPEAAAARAAGEAALQKGQVATVVLNGGMATRFGGVVKGTVEVYDGKSFLALKAEDARRANERWGAPVPLVLMNSFATEEATRQHFAAGD